LASRKTWEQSAAADPTFADLAKERIDRAKEQEATFRELLDRARSS
jgi:hypothetical protein